MKSLLGCAALVLVSSFLSIAAWAQQDPSLAFKVKIGVTDFQNSVKFYENFGLKEAKRYNAKELGMEWTKKQLVGVTNIILVDPTIVKPGGAFIVVFVPDLQAMRKQLVDRGVKDIRDYPNAESVRLLLVKDPDGNTVELVQRANAE